jgi:hypothetical protein
MLGNYGWIGAECAAAMFRPKRAMLALAVVLRAEV